MTSIVIGMSLGLHLSPFLFYHRHPVGPAHPPFQPPAGAQLKTDRITPPIEGAKLAALGELEGEKDDDSANDGADVEAGGEEKVVLGSPAELHPAEHILEDEADEDPQHVVDGRRRRDPAGPQ
ncbi:hypothetical protein PCANC_24140 [Puccinia coronata f. sp. avenae]|uniref:Uncharacterized protein n=1 Tax=Puccinia coronata f. sp. avenae TaxID=200324 RepID=A0A2N5TQB6_9BASI|nr:hypothetical protein PCANC_24140 [Puccinia coronata f. sp. avenae]